MALSVFLMVGAAIGVVNDSFTVIPRTAVWPVTGFVLVVWVAFEIWREHTKLKRALPFPPLSVRFFLFAVLAVVWMPSLVGMRRNEVVVAEPLPIESSGIGAVNQERSKPEQTKKEQPEPDPPVKLSYVRLFGALQVPFLASGLTNGAAETFPFDFSWPRREWDQGPLKDAVFSRDFAFSAILPAFESLYANLHNIKVPTDELKAGEGSFTFPAEVQENKLWAVSLGRAKSGIESAMREHFSGDWDSMAYEDDKSPEGVRKYEEGERRSSNGTQELLKRSQRIGFLFAELRPDTLVKCKSCKIIYRQVPQSQLSRTPDLNSAQSVAQGAALNVKELSIDALNGKPLLVLLYAYEANADGYPGTIVGDFVKLERIEWVTPESKLQTSTVRAPLGQDAVRVKVPLGWYGQ